MRNHVLSKVGQKSSGIISNISKERGLRIGSSSVNLAEGSAQYAHLTLAPNVALRNAHLGEWNQAYSLADRQRFLIAWDDKQ